MDIRKRQPAKKEKFYVFSGIEKTLIGQNFIDSYYGGKSEFLDTAALSPKCVKAFNYMLRKLGEKFDVRLVITSKKRRDEASCESYLKLYGLDYHKPIYFTRYLTGPRGEKIVKFLEENGASPLTFHISPLYVRIIKNLKDNPDFKNYVVVEGANKHLSRFIPHHQIKQVSAKTGFTVNDANDILIANGIEPQVIEKNKN